MSCTAPIPMTGAFPVMLYGKAELRPPPTIAG
jgi:hypothetical protein